MQNYRVVDRPVERYNVSTGSPPENGKRLVKIGAVGENFSPAVVEHLIAMGAVQSLDGISVRRQDLPAAQKIVESFGGTMAAPALKSLSAHSEKMYGH